MPVYFDSLEPILPSEEFEPVGRIYVGDGVIRDDTKIVYSEVQRIYDELKLQIQAEERVKRLHQHRTFFGVLVALAVMALAISLYYSVPYQPAAAIFFAAVGTLVVAQMKINEIKNAAERTPK